MRRTLSSAGALAQERGERIYLVGGAVRDLLLGRVVRDADLALEGDAPSFSRTLAQRLGASLRAHARFGTATLRLPDGSRLDLAGSRRESYSAPGVLPKVSLSAPIEEDLARRDFPIHAMAYALAGRSRWIDPFGGGQDLAARRIRFLHPGSPTDDPTRALRAVRYANRLGFTIAPEAKRAIAASIGRKAVERVSGDRLRRELALIFGEPGRARAFRSLRALGLDRAIAPALARPPARRIAARLRALEALASSRGTEAGWLCYLLAWMADLSAREIRAVAGRLALAGGEREVALRFPQTRRRLRSAAGRSLSFRRRRTRGLTADEVLAAAAALPAARRRAVLELLEAPPTISISGDDLLAHGIPPGPALGRALEAVRAAREDGRLRAPDELSFALRAARRFAGRKP